MAGDSAGDRSAFAERVRLQVASRYRGTSVEVDPARYALHVRGTGIDVVLPLATLHAACEREPARIPQLVGEFVRSVESAMVPRSADSVSLARVLWCVRTQRYLESLARSEELLTEPVGGDMVAFVAESLPGQVMRGVARGEWEDTGVDRAQVRRAADTNTAQRFAKVAERVAAIDRIPADGWRLAGDSLYQGSIVMVPSLLRALVERAGGDILIGLPDRALTLVIPASLPAAESFARRVTAEWRESMNPCSRQVLRSDGETVRAVDRPRRQTSLLPWLND